MFPPSARTGVVQDYPQYQGVQNFYNIQFPFTGNVQKAWNWQTNSGIWTDTAFTCSYSHNGESCGCYGQNPYFPYNCYTGDVTYVGAPSYGSPTFCQNSSITGGYYNNTTRSGWKYIAHLVAGEVGALYDISTENCTYNNCYNGYGSIAAYLQAVSGGIIENGGSINSGNIGIKYDGTLWAWGGTNFMRLAGWNVGSQNDPYQLGTDTWKGIAFDETYNSTLAIKTDGTLWAWGNNGNVGILGDNSITSKSSPVQIGTGADWQYVTIYGGSTFALKNDGALWAWGYNYNGCLGLNTTATRSSPVQVGTGTGWVEVDTSGYNTLAIKSDGTLWAWGDNSNGQLGQGNNTNRSSPVQVGTGTNWKKCSATSSTGAVAIKTDGTAWIWGVAGKYGSGTFGGQTSPVQAGGGSGPSDHVDFVNAKGATGGDGATYLTTDRKKMVTYAFNSTGRTSTGVLAGPYYTVGDRFQLHKTWFGYGDFGSALKSGR